MDNFKVGDLVLIRKPDDTLIHPKWIMDMDKYNGVIREIEKLSDFNSYVVIIEGYFFHKDWLIKATKLAKAMYLA